MTGKDLHDNYRQRLWDTSGEKMPAWESWPARYRDLWNWIAAQVAHSSACVEGSAVRENHQRDIEILRLRAELKHSRTVVANYIQTITEQSRKITELELESKSVVPNRKTVQTGSHRALYVIPHIHKLGPDDILRKSVDDQVPVVISVEDVELAGQLQALIAGGECEEEFVGTASSSYLSKKMAHG